MKKIKVRFNLGRGANFMKWKIHYTNGTSEYHSPDEVQLTLSQCTLKNHKTIANKIFKEANKSVCAWVLCDDIEIKKISFKQEDISKMTELKYNPRITPNWIIENIIADEMNIEELTSIGRKLYINNK